MASGLDRSLSWRLRSRPPTDLEATVAIQATVIAELRASNAEQARLIATLQTRMVELERRLGKDSSNSHLPPSFRLPGQARAGAAAGCRPGRAAPAWASSTARPAPIWPRSPSLTSLPGMSRIGAAAAARS
jgi:uncharacterized coiled-coil protein SlyX